MKRKVKKYAEGGTNVRTRTDEEFAEDNKFGGYGRYMPKTRSITLGGKSSAEEDRPKSSGVEDYESLGKRAPAKSTMSGPIEYITDSSKEDTKEESPKGIASGFDAKQYLADSGPKDGGSGRKSITRPEKKKSPVDNSLRLIKPKEPSKALEEARKHYAGYEDTGAKIGSQGDFKMKPSVPVSTSGMGPKNTFLTKERMGVKDTSTGSFMDRVREHLGNEFKSKKMASGGKVSSASSRGDGIAQRGKTRGRMR
jgi:hypothetical protein